MRRNLGRHFLQNAPLGTSAARKRKPRSSDNPERIAQKDPRRKNAKSMFGNGTEMAVTSVKASSKQRMRWNWTSMAGIRKSTMRSPTVGIFARILAPSNPMNSTPMTLTTLSPIYPLQARLALHLTLNLHQSIPIHHSIPVHNRRIPSVLHMPSVLHISCSQRRCQFLVWQPQGIPMRTSGRLQELEGGEPEPLTANRWRSRIRASAPIRRVNTVMRSSSAAFLASLPVEPF
jgi:hypothetical protein